MPLMQAAVPFTHTTLPCMPTTLPCTPPKKSFISHAQPYSATSNISKSNSSSLGGVDATVGFEEAREELVQKKQAFAQHTLSSLLRAVLGWER
eukprot:3593733-Rhodomonas_salina.2